MSCSALNVDLRHKDPPFFWKLLSLRDRGFLSACVLKGTWELAVGGAGGERARPKFFKFGVFFFNLAFRDLTVKILVAVFLLKFRI